MVLRLTEQAVAASVIVKVGRVGEVPGGASSIPSEEGPAVSSRRSTTGAWASPVMVSIESVLVVMLMPGS
jgi:hypothetical protein